MAETSLVQEIVNLVGTRVLARFQLEVVEAVRQAEQGRGVVHPLADLDDSARAELVRITERLELGKPAESEGLLAALQALDGEIRPCDFELMLEGWVPMSQAGHLCREIEALLDPEGDITPTPAQMRAAATVSCTRLWEEWLAAKRSSET